MIEKYIFTYNQLKVLLMGCGYSRITGLNLGGSGLSDEAALEALNQLSNIKMIVSDGNRFLGSEKAKLIANRLGIADTYIAIHTPKENLPDLCCYPDEKILICGSEACYDNRVSVRFSDFNDFFTDLCDEGYLPEDSEEMVLDNEELENYEIPIFEKYQPNSPIDSELPIIFSAELINIKGTSLGYLRIIKYYFFNYIVFLYDGKIERQLYSNKVAMEYLKRLMNQNDNS